MDNIKTKIKTFEHFKCKKTYQKWQGDIVCSLLLKCGWTQWQESKICLRPLEITASITHLFSLSGFTSVPWQKGPRPSGIWSPNQVKSNLNHKTPPFLHPKWARQEVRHRESKAYRGDFKTRVGDVWMQEQILHLPWIGALHNVRQITWNSQFEWVVRVWLVVLSASAEDVIGAGNSFKVLVIRNNCQHAQVWLYKQVWVKSINQETRRLKLLWGIFAIFLKEKNLHL